MSYCRKTSQFRWRGQTVESDVYVFHCIPTPGRPYGHLECCYCELLPVQELRPRWRFKGKKLVQTTRKFWCNLFGNYETTSRGEMICHLYDHRQAGHHVPGWAFTRLYEELTQAGDHVRRRPRRG